MTSGAIRFDRFTLDPHERRLWRDDEAVEVNARYLDALVLLAGQPGGLVTKDRFLEEVWRGVPVTDEALTQCIRTLRRLLGDDAARPRFIETVPKYGYRFVASVERGAEPAAERATAAASWRRTLLLAGAGTVGAGIAGVIGGLIYGFVGASQPPGTGIGAASIILVLLCVTIVAALVGGAGVSLGLAIVDRLRSGSWWHGVAGGAVGGLVTGAVAKLVGLDAFNLLIGRSPADITGAGEGLVLGGAVGLAAWLAERAGGSIARRVGVAAATGAAGGIAIALAGGRMMAGSLQLLTSEFPGSRLRLDRIGGLFGEGTFGTIAHIASCAFEGALFAACIVGALTLARRSLARG